MQKGNEGFSTLTLELVDLCQKVISHVSVCFCV